MKLSRRAPEDVPSDPMPPALPARVFARLRPGDRASVSPWEWLSLRAVPVAAATAGVCVFLGDGLRPEVAADEQRLAHAIVQQQFAP